MKIKKIGIIALISVFVLILASCPGVVPSIVQGYLLSVDADGHFGEDLTYNSGSTTYIYRQDGTFQVQAVDTAGNITGGSQGTYTWNQTTLELVLTYGKYYSTTSNAWEDYIDGKTETITYYFSSQRLGNAYKLVENTENTYRWVDETVNENGNTETTTITVTVGTSSFTYNYVWTVDDNSGTRTSGYEVNVTGSIDALYPEGVMWENGKTVTMSITHTASQERSWSTASAAWGSWSDNNLDKELRTYANMGTYVIERTGTNWIPLR